MVKEDDGDAMVKEDDGDAMVKEDDGDAMVIRHALDWKMMVRTVSRKVRQDAMVKEDDGDAMVKEDDGDADYIYGTWQEWMKLLCAPDWRREVKGASAMHEQAALHGQKGGDCRKSNRGYGTSGKAKARYKHCCRLRRHASRRGSVTLSCGGSLSAVPPRDP